MYIFMYEAYLIAMFRAIKLTGLLAYTDTNISVLHSLPLQRPDITL